ncbi:YeeE/YedE family protein [Kistimonas scapharcae]|uniref:YeeE/YedE family protein n=1 Tax=Kistimonas scapharcae TaxID=1036133 RepID=A0ABP8V569_9GAMM
MKQIVIAILSGLLFGAGLAISGMLNPEKVLGFLDITGHWDPTLALVMGGALLVNIPATRWTLRQPSPKMASSFSLPSLKQVDKPLVVGAVLFGMGWGLVGLCPGPAITLLAGGSPQVVLFVCAMLAGLWLQPVLTNYLKRPFQQADA